MSGFCWKWLLARVLWLIIKGFRRVRGGVRGFKARVDQVIKNDNS